VNVVLCVVGCSMGRLVGRWCEFFCVVCRTVGNAKGVVYVLCVVVDEILCVGDDVVSGVI
jgi:hypothetical protein